MPDVGWLVPVSVLGGLGNGGVNNATGVLVGRRAPAAVRGHAFAVLSAAAGAATTFGYLLGGILLALIPVRTVIASAGLAGLTVTAVFALPVLRAAARERDHSRNAERLISSPAGHGGAPPANETEMTWTTRASDRQG